jgi:hypothetical protein
MPHPERETPEIRRMQPNLETEVAAMKVVLEYENSKGRQDFESMKRTWAMTSRAST